MYIHIYIIYIYIFVYILYIYIYIYIYIFIFNCYLAIWLPHGQPYAIIGGIAPLTRC